MQIENSNINQFKFEVIIVNSHDLNKNILKKFENNFININSIFSGDIIENPDEKNYYFDLNIITNQENKYSFFANNKQLIMKMVKQFLTDFYDNNKTFFNKDGILNQTNIIEKIKYDWNSINKELEIMSKEEEEEKKENKKKETKYNDYKQLFIYNEEDINDRNILTIGKDYYNKLLSFVDKLLNFINKKKPNYGEIKILLQLFENTKNEAKYISKFKSLIENWKCKTFYQYYMEFLCAQLYRKINNLLADFFELKIDS